VTRLEVSHAPTHKKSIPKWKAEKSEKAKQAARMRKLCAAKDNNPDKKPNGHKANKDKEKTKEERSRALEALDKKDNSAYNPNLESSTPKLQPTKTQQTNIFYNPTPSTCEEIKGRSSEDKFHKLIIENPSHFKKFKVDDNLIYINESKGKALRMPDIEIEGSMVENHGIKHTGLLHVVPCMHNNKASDPNKNGPIDPVRPGKRTLGVCADQLFWPAPQVRKP
jgi:hypothetical protein